MEAEGVKFTSLVLTGLLTHIIFECFIVILDMYLDII